MKWVIALCLLALGGCGWQPAGSALPTPAVASAISVAVGHRITIIQPNLPAGEFRSATSSLPATATAAIDANGNLVIVGVAAGTANVTRSDGTSAGVVDRQTYTVTVTPL